jgi:hypothetical protein
MNMQRGVSRSVLWLILMVAWLAGLVACRPREIPLSFETIEKGEFPPETPQHYESKVPKLVIISGAADIVELSHSVSPKAEAVLRELNFSQYFAVAVFQGLKPWANYSVEIRQIIYQDNTVTIYAHFSEPKPGTQLPAVETSPYHLVEVLKEGLSANKEFILDADGTTVDHQTHTLP